MGECPLARVFHHAPVAVLIHPGVVQSGIALHKFLHQHLLGAVDHHVAWLVAHQVQLVVGVGGKVAVPVQMFFKKRCQHRGLWRVGETVALVTTHLGNHPFGGFHVPQRNAQISPEGNIEPVRFQDVV